ncbi:MAG: sigma-70 family RNA polymerase sigma factor [Pirellulaceae bacterium]
MFKSLERWDDTRPFEPWLLAIAGNRCRTRLARRASTPRCVTLEESDVAQSYDSDQARQIDEEVRLALCEVTPRYRQAFLGFREHGLSYAQIAEWLEVPLGTVKTWVRRARIQLMDRLKARGAIEESQHELRQGLRSESSNCSTVAKILGMTSSWWSMPATARVVGDRSHPPFLARGILH